MKFSIIIPSFNQPQYIARTLQNLAELKLRAPQKGYEIEVLIFDNCSDKKVLDIINQYSYIFDHIDVSKDKGQFDAINKGILKITGEYWTWLNTDDYIEIDGFLKLADILKKNKGIQYIYGDIDIIDENDNIIRSSKAYDLSLDFLIHKNPSVFQPGSFFKKSLTDKIGLLADNQACFDYEYILRLLKNKAEFFRCGFVVSKFRYYSNSKSGSIVPVFIKEQLKISKSYGRHFFSKHTLIGNLRLFKHWFIGMK